MMCLVLLATLVPRAADAADWKRLFGDYDAKAWVRQHFLQERHSGDYAYNVLNGLNSFDCRNKKVNLLQVEVYQDDRAVDSYTPNASGGDRPIIPGTVEYFAYRYLCTPSKK
jgi:hypothetical protein